jgi:hypothetical protein
MVGWSGGYFCVRGTTRLGPANELHKLKHVSSSDLLYCRYMSVSNLASPMGQSYTCALGARRIKLGIPGSLYEDEVD